MYIFPLLTLLSIYYYYNKKNGKDFGPINFLILIYIIMGSVALILEFSGIFPSVYPFSFIPMIYLALSFILTFIGFFNFNDKNFIGIRIQNLKLFALFENFLLYGGFSSIFFFLPFAINGLTGDVELNRLGVYDFQKDVLAKYGILNSLMSLFANLFIFSILLAFIRFIDQDNYKSQLKGYLLLISSFSYIVVVLAYVGRDGIIYWLMSYLFIFFLLKKYIPNKIRRRLLHQYLFFIGIFAFPFMIITIARFSTMTGGVGWRLLEYAGCQLKNFNDSFYINPPLLYGRYTMPILSDILTFIGFNIEKAKFEDIWPHYLAYGVEPWTFKTFIGDLLMDFGRGGTLLYLLIFAFFSRLSIKKGANEGVFTFSNLIIFILFYQMILWGVFYFRFYSLNFYIVAVILIALAFKIFKSHSDQKLITMSKR